MADGGRRPKTPPWDDLYQYWLSKHVEGRAPSRKDLDPLLEIPRLVPHLMMLEVMPDGYSYRLFGSAVARRIGIELTGKTLGTSALNADTKAAWIRLLDQVRDDQRPRIVVARLRPLVEARQLTLLLPLVDRAGRTERILCGAFYDGDFDAGPEPESFVVSFYPG